MIHVCSLAALHDVVRSTGASHVLTIMGRDAVAHRTFEIGLRAWVEEQDGLMLCYF